MSRTARILKEKVQNGKYYFPKESDVPAGDSAGRKLVRKAREDMEEAEKHFEGHEDPSKS